MLSLQVNPLVLENGAHVRMGIDIGTRRYRGDRPGYQGVINQRGDMRCAACQGLEHAQAAEQVEIQIKYAGYIERQQDEVEKLLRNEHTLLPLDLDYRDVNGLSNEVVAKLNDAKPQTIGQASRISGITPAAISILLVHLKKHGLLRKTA